MKYENKVEREEEYEHGEQLIKDYDFIGHIDKKKERMMVEIRILMKEGKRFGRY